MLLKVHVDPFFFFFFFIFAGEWPYMAATAAILKICYGHILANHEVNYVETFDVATGWRVDEK